MRTGSSVGPLGEILEGEADPTCLSLFCLRAAVESFLDDLRQACLLQCSGSFRAKSTSSRSNAWQRIVSFSMKERSPFFGSSAVNVS